MSAPTCITHSVRPEHVEGLPFPWMHGKEERGFDKLSPNGWEVREGVVPCGSAS
jgi:hypothetical protein